MMKLYSLLTISTLSLALPAQILNVPPGPYQQGQQVGCTIANGAMGETLTIRLTHKVAGGADVVSETDITCDIDGWASFMFRPMPGYDTVTIELVDTGEAYTRDISQ